MADGTQLPVGGGGDKIDTEDIGARGKLPRSKLVVGALDVDGGDVATGNPLPVTGTVTANQGGAWTVTVSGTVTVSDSTQLPAGLGQKTMAASLPVAVASDQSAVPVSGTVAVSAVANPLPAGTNVLGGVTQSGSWNVGVTGTVTVSGTVTATLGTTTNAGATAKTFDLDTGAGVDTVTAFAIALPASGGAVVGGTATNPLRIDPTGTTTQPVSGTVSAAQSGAWNVTNVTGTVSLPTGAAQEHTTAASPHSVELTDGTAFYVGAKTGQLPASLGQKTMANSVGVAIASDQSAVPVSGTLTANQGTAAALASAWPVQLTDGTHTMPTGDAAARTIHVTADNATVAVTQSGAPWSENVTQFGGSAVVTGTGAAGAGVPRVTVSNDSAVLASPQAATSGGATPYRYLAAAAANQDATSVKGSAGQVYSVACFNVTGAVEYLKLYDKASAPTSADTPVQTYAVPAATTGAGFTLALPVGMKFTSGIAFRLTKGQADNDATAVAAGDLAVNLTYD